jgi:hypothetical protein
LKSGIVSADEMKAIDEMADLVARVIAVDDFTPEELPRYFGGYKPNAQNRFAQKHSAKSQPKQEAAQ